MDERGLRNGETAAVTHLALSQGIKQRRKAVVIQLLHQRQQTADFAGRKACASKPVKVWSGQAGNQAAFVLAVRHRERNQAV